MKIKHFLLTAFVLFTGVSGVYAGRKYVGFLSENTHGNDLSAALAASTIGDTVFVAVGLYVATDSAFLVPANVTLIGGYAKGDIGATTRRYPGQFVPFTTTDLSTTTEFTVLDGNAHNKLPADKHRVVTVNAGGVVDGCLIRNGHVRNDHGGGVLLNGGKLYNSIVRGNVAMSKPDTSIESLGGGVFIKNGGELVNCLVAYNMANDGYGVAAGEGGGKMINNTITANTYSPVFAKIPGGTFQLYKGSNTISYREVNPTWPGDTIPKCDQKITLTPFYISRILTTQGQFAVFCAAMDIANGQQLNDGPLKSAPDPIKGGTVEQRYAIGGSATMRNVLQNATDENAAGLKYDGAGVWHPIGDTATVEYPMGNASWIGCLAYAVWLGGGLPTRAQWEFAARCEPNGRVNDNLYSGAYGSKVAVSGENKDTATWRILDTIAWVHPTLSIDTATNKLGIQGGTVRPHEVARKRPNSMGIYDMTGSMNEWCGDYYITRTSPLYTTSAEDPIQTSTGSPSRVYCFGAHSSESRTSFSLTNYNGTSQFTLTDVGVRPVAVF